MASGKHDRRQFLNRVAIGITGSGFATNLVEHVTALGAETRQGMPYRMLGRTGEKVSLLGLGGYHIGVPENEQESIRIVRAAMDSGVNFLDNSWDYNDGQSEIRMGKALRDGYRQKAFLMTKVNGRTAASVAQQLEQSLKRLETDHVDLLQFHAITGMSEPDQILAAGGALDAAIAAKKAGRIRYIGFTGHSDPKVHLKMIDLAFMRGFVFDTVQMPLNVMDAHQRGFAAEVLPVLVEHRIGVLAMKTLGGGAILGSGTLGPIECLHYAMNLPASVVINGCDSMERLQQGLNAARTYRPLSKSELETLLKQTAMAGKDGHYEPFKSPLHVDGTGSGPEWLA